MNCDVLILGAGPAGSTLARRLAGAGFSVRLADRKQFPRLKPCGEFLSPQCVPFLRELGLEEELNALGPRVVRGMHIHADGAKALGRFRRVGSRPDFTLAGLAIRRERFDDMLLRGAVEAGSEWMPRHALESLERSSDGRVTGATLRQPDGHRVKCAARWVVGADGVHSAVARALEAQRPVPWLDRFALVTRYQGVASSPLAEVHLFDGGFFAATTVDEGLFSLNLIVDRKALRTRRAKDWDQFLTTHLERAPALQGRLAAAARVDPWKGIGPLAHTTTAQTFAGAALVGDACGYVDPLTGEGIYFALFGASALATSLEAALHDPSRERVALADYARRRRREIGPRLRASRWLQRALRHPWLVRSILKRAARWPSIADFMVTLSGDSIHPRDLLSPTFWRDFRRAEHA